MLRNRLSVALVAALLAAPVSAKWHTTDPAVRAAAADPAIAGALAAIDAIDTAIVTGNRDGFVGAFADDALVNSPFNNVADKALATARFTNGSIDYISLDRNVERVARRPSGEVAVMGEEVLRPRGSALHAGKTVRRRFTDVWRNDAGTWKLALRQATIFEVK